jgi:hypothetical protein
MRKIDLIEIHQGIQPLRFAETGFCHWHAKKLLSKPLRGRALTRARAIENDYKGNLKHAF